MSIRSLNPSKNIQFTFSVFSRSDISPFYKLPFKTNWSNERLNVIASSGEESMGITTGNAKLDILFS